MSLVIKHRHLVTPVSVHICVWSMLSLSLPIVCVVFPFLHVECQTMKILTSNGNDTELVDIFNNQGLIWEDFHFEEDYYKQQDNIINRYNENKKDVHRISEITIKILEKLNNYDNA